MLQQDLRLQVRCKWEATSSRARYLCDDLFLAQWLNKSINNLTA